MIDIHSHILPGIDDGADNLAMTMEMLIIAANSGVTDIVATPHCNIPGSYDNYADESLKRLSNQVLEEKNFAEIPIRLHKGMEIFATADLDRLLEDGKAWTVGEGKYFLTEFSFDEEPDFCSYILNRCVKKGFHPVIAHPERYYFVQEDPQIAFEWCIKGYALQVNKGSLLGRFGSREQALAKKILSHGLAACVASDAHKITHRSTYMAEVERFICMEYGETYADILLKENPRRILKGRDLLGYEPVPF